MMHTVGKEYSVEDVLKASNSQIVGDLKSYVEFLKKTKSEEEQILFCVGLGYGEILNIGYADVFGAEVNAASKLGEDTAKAWEVLVTENVKKEINQLDEKEIRSFKFLPIDFVPPGAKGSYKVIF